MKGISRALAIIVGLAMLTGCSKRLLRGPRFQRILRCQGYTGGRLGEVPRGLRREGLGVQRSHM